MSTKNKLAAGRAQSAHPRNAFVPEPASPQTGARGAQHAGRQARRQTQCGVRRAATQAVNITLQRHAEAASYLL